MLSVLLLTCLPACTQTDPSSSAGDPSKVPTGSPFPSSSEAPEDGSAEAPVPLVYIPGYRVKVRVRSARIRAESNLQSDVLYGAEEGEVLDVIGVENEFYVLERNGRQVYIHESVVEYGPFEKPIPPETVPPLVYVPGYRVRVTAHSARIRAAASLQSDVIDGAEEGDVLDVVGVENDFYVIDRNGRKAYMHKSVAEYGPFEKPPAPAVTPTEKPTVPPTEAAHRPANGTIVFLDAGHGPGGEDSGLEPNWPGSTEMKMRLTAGTTGELEDGIYTEWRINGQVTDRLKAELESRGYTVLTADRSLSNAERAEQANASGASAFIRLHCNAIQDETIRGLITYLPTAGNPSPYITEELISDSRFLSMALEQKIMEAAAALNDPGYVFRGRQSGNSMTGINWSKIPVVIVEMAFMSNEADLRLLISPAFQQAMAKGIADGLDVYFGY